MRIRNSDNHLLEYDPILATKKNKRKVSVKEFIKIATSTNTIQAVKD
jgi:hypothetical protein